MTSVLIHNGASHERLTLVFENVPPLNTPPLLVKFDGSTANGQKCSPLYIVTPRQFSTSVMSALGEGRRWTQFSSRGNQETIRVLVAEKQGND